MQTSQTVSIIDTFGYFFRNFYALPKLTSREGFPTGVLLGFVNLINQLYIDKSTHIIFALEGQGEKWRKSIYPAYKANRKDADKDLIAQIEVAIEWIAKMRLKSVAIDGFEADDAIATLSHLAKDAHLAVRIVSVDKDLYQLIDSNTHIFDPSKKREVREKECFEKFGIYPRQFVDYQSLVGDSSDNIAGVSGIGAKSAQSLIEQFDSLDNLYANLAQVAPKMASKISAGKDSAYLSQKLVRLRSDLLNHFDFDSCLKPHENPLFLIEGELEKYNINILSKIKREQNYETSASRPLSVDLEEFDASIDSKSYLAPNSPKNHRNSPQNLGSLDSSDSREFYESSAESCHFEQSEKSKKSSETKNFNASTTPPSPLPLKGEWESLDSYGLSPTYFLEKSKQKNMDLSESDEILSALNSQSCDNLGNSRESQDISSSTQLIGVLGEKSPLSSHTSPSIAEGVGGWLKSQNPKDSRESKNLLPTFSKSRWGKAQTKNNTSPSPCGRGLGGGVESQDTEFTQNSRELKEIFRQMPQNDKMPNSRESQNFGESKQFLDCHENPYGFSRNDDNGATCHENSLEFPRNGESMQNSHESTFADSHNAKSALDSHDQQSNAHIVEIPHDSQNLTNPHDSPHSLESRLTNAQKIAILDSDALFKIIDSIPQDAFVAFDTETDSLDSNSANIVGFSFAWELDCGFYVPLRHSYLGAPPQISHESAKRALQNLFTRQIIAHNAKFDLKIIWHNFALDIVRIIDTMILAWLDSSNEPCGLDISAKTRLNYTTIKFDEVVPKKATFDTIQIANATAYAAEDALCALALFAYFRANLSPQNFEIAKSVEFPIIKILAQMERSGISIDAEFFGILRDELNEKIEHLSKDIFALCGAEFNLNSPRQLSDILYGHLGLKKGRALKNNAYSTDEKTLESLRESHAVIPLLIEYREISKLLNTYILPFLNINKNRKIHTSFIQTGTSTGRIASKNPNLQNIPVRSEMGRKIRRGFVAKNGHSFISADYSQIELRLLAHFSGDKNLIEAFQNGKDIHLETAVRIFGESSAKEKRNIAKSINFGLIYGMGARKLAQDLKISQNEAKSYIEEYFKAFPTIGDFLEEKEREILALGYAETLLGHRRKFDFSRVADYEAKAFLREGINAIFQGSAADLIKLAMIECDKRLENANLLLQIHDELLFEVPDSALEVSAKEIENIMNNIYALKIPLVCGISVGKNWAELK